MDEVLFEAGQLYTLSEAAAVLRVSKVTLLRAIERRDLQAFRVGGQWRILGGQLNRYVRSRPTRRHGRGGPAYEKK